MLLYQDIHMLEDAWKKKDWKEGIIGAILLRQFGTQVRQVLMQCMPAHGKWGTYDNVFQSLEHGHFQTTPEVFAEGFGDMHVALKAFEEKKYFEFGKFVGEGLVKVTGADTENLFLY